MPNLRSQSLTPDGITLTGSDGRTVTITKAQIIALYQTTSGSASSRKTQTLALVRDSIQTALGAEQVPTAKVTGLDFDPADGAPTKLEVS